MASSPPRGRMQEIRHYQTNTSSGVPIKIMTLGLLGLTSYFAYDLWQKKRLPHQNGVSVTEHLFERWGWR